MVVGALGACSMSSSNDKLVGWWGGFDLLGRELMRCWMVVVAVVGVGLSGVGSMVMAMGGVRCHVLVRGWRDGGSGAGWWVESGGGGDG